MKIDSLYLDSDCKNRYSSNYIILMMIETIIILFGTNTIIASILGFIVLAVSFLRMDEDVRTTTLFYLLPFSTIFKLSPESTSFFTIIELEYIFLHLYDKRFKIRNISIILVFFAFYNLLLGGRSDVFALLSIVKMMCNCSVLFVILSNRRQYKPIFLAYIMGYIVSSCLFFLDSSLFRISSYTSVKTILLGEVYISRFAGLYGDPNYYVINIILGLMMLSILWARKELNTIVAVVLYVALIVFVALSNSKSGLFMLVFPLILLLKLLNVNKRYFMSMLGAVVVIIFLSLLITGKVTIFNEVISRFLTSKGSLDALTTNRTFIWRKYGEYLTENPMVVLFGRSLGYTQLDNMAAHNTLIDMIYQLGIMGSFLLIVLLRNASVQVRNVKFVRKYYNYFPLLCICIMYFFLSELQYFDPPFHLSLAFIILNMDLEANHEYQNEITKSIG